MSKKNVPMLRFEGFSDAWEQRKLGDLGSVAMNKRIFKDQTSENGEVPFFKIGTFGSYPDAFISRELFEEYKSKYPYPEVGDILISASGSIGRTVVYQGEDEYFQDSNIVWLKHNGHLDNKFLQQFYSIVKWQGLEGSTIKRLYNKNIIDTNIKVPTLDEQNKLGVFFEQLDYTLALHQRKLEQLKRLKQGFLQVLFANETNVPKMRFAGFTEEWEQRKVVQIAKDTYGGGTPKTSIKKFWNGDIPWIQSSDLETNRLFNVSPKKRITDEAVQKSATKIIPSNSIAIVTRVGVGKLALMSFEYATSQDFLSLSELQVDPYFGIYSLYTMLQKDLNNIQGTSIKGMTKSDLLVKKLTVPKSIEEQEKIGIFFKQLDDTLALNQNKLSQLKNLKKALLQSMFI
ncbi:restriction endonuclease subunit S [Enterococcus sp. DIV2381]|uniref:restriction endonuclease subunit S n=3 Tax=unclassified Enterococcus TaxID=2608891 RepID=UPI003D2BB4F0